MIIELAPTPASDFSLDQGGGLLTLSPNARRASASHGQNAEPLFAALTTTS